MSVAQLSKDFEMMPAPYKGQSHSPDSQRILSLVHSDGVLNVGLV